MLVAVVGCVHGELKRIYSSISLIEKQLNKTVDLVLLTGDLQTARTKKDLNSMAVPDKYKKMGDFHEYYNGNLKIPILTIAIGGNHECSDYLMDYPRGGFLMNNFYYMGFSSIVKAKGISIAGWSGIYNVHNFEKPRNESKPLQGNSVRSIYHVRKQDFSKLSQYSGKVDIGMSHDWPGGVAYYGNTSKILKERPWFKSDIENNQLGNPYALKLMQILKPTYWVSSHMHYKFTCQVGATPLNFDNGNVTKDPNIVQHAHYITFVALDKPKGKRLDFLELLEIENETFEDEVELLLS